MDCTLPKLDCFEPVEPAGIETSIDGRCGTWRVVKDAKGGYSIFSPSGILTGCYKDTDVMALHMAITLDELTHLRKFAMSE